MTRAERLVIYAALIVLGLLATQPRTRINVYDCQGAPHANGPRQTSILH